MRTAKPEIGTEIRRQTEIKGERNLFRDAPTASSFTKRQSDITRDPRVRLGLTPSVSPVTRPASNLSQPQRGPPASQTLPPSSQREGDSRGMQGFTRRASDDARKSMAVAAATSNARSVTSSSSDPFSARPLPRPHEPVDLTEFLIERRAAPASFERTTQTDPLADLPPPVPYAPAKTGVDAGTQVTQGDRKKRTAEAAIKEDRLFDFDTAVEPVVSVLADKILETALTEVVRERSLAALSQRRTAAHAGLNQERQAEAALIEKAKASVLATQTLLSQARERVAAEMACARKVAAVAASNRAVASIVSGALSILTYRGHFADPVRTAVSTSVMPGLLAAVQSRLGRSHASEVTVDSLLGGALESGAAAYAARLAKEAESRRTYLIKVYVKLPPALSKGLGSQQTATAGHGDAVVGGGAVPTITEAEVEDDEEEPEDDEEQDEDGEVSPRKAARRLAAGGSVVVLVGPVPVTRRDTVQAVELRIFEWVRDAASATGSPSAESMARVMELSLGRPLHLYLQGSRLPVGKCLLDWPLEQLADLELRPDPEAATGLMDTSRL